MPIAGIVPVFNLSVTRLRCQRPLFHSRALPVKELFETTAGPELRGGQRLQSHGRRVLGGGEGGAPVGEGRGVDCGGDEGGGVVVGGRGQRHSRVAGFESRG